MVIYHDTEWGTPQHDDKALFELLTLEGAQAGLSWEIILKRRQAYKDAFLGFDPEQVARLDQADVDRLLTESGIVRNRAKVESTLGNARALLELREQHGSFDAYVWRFVGETPRHNPPQALADIPAQTAESEAMSKELRKAGFRFVGPTICYAFMQAAGLVNDHQADCFRYAQLTSTDR